MASVAVSPGEVAELDEFGERILDAAFEQFRRFGIRRSSIDDVARRAKVGRATVFRRFETKEGLVRALLLREGQRLSTRIDAAMREFDTVEDRIVEGFLLTLRDVRRNPLLAGVLSAEPDLLLPLFTVEGAEALALARGFLARHVRYAHRKLGIKGDVEQTAELLARIAISLLLTPETSLPLEDEGRARKFARRHLVPMVLGQRPSENGTGR